MTKDEALKMAIKDHEEIMMHAGVLYPREFEKSFLKTYEAMKEALEQPSNMVAVPLDKLQDMQRRLSDCEEYLKEDETPAECIARNRKDANTTLKLLAKCMGEKKALEQPLTRDWKDTIDERIAKDSEFKEALEQPTVAELNDEYLRDFYVDGLNQPAQEPVAWIDVNDKLPEIEINFLSFSKIYGYQISMYSNNPLNSTQLPTLEKLKIDKWMPIPKVYTPPYQWQGLTDDELSHLKYLHVDYELFDEGEYGTECNVYVDDFAKAIDDLLKEKNT